MQRDSSSKVCLGLQKESSSKGAFGLRIGESRVKYEYDSPSEAHRSRLYFRDHKEKHNYSDRIHIDEKYEVLLENINFTIKSGEKWAIMGREGSGINALFLSLLGETHLLRGKVKLSGTTNYVSWDRRFFLEASLRENIILGKEFLIDKYIEILEACELDIEAFQDYDQLILVEGAINISTFEQLKILLARMLYQGGEIYL
jgi:ABC-type multidrug transport system fused ATPase/permease subunit